MHALILVNGAPPTQETALRLAVNADLIIATDGAAHTAVSLGITPHIVSGDFDSIALEEAKKALPHTRFIPTPDQNLADLEKALLVAKREGAASADIIGAMGGRLDHTLTAFAVLLRWENEMELRILEGNQEAVSLSGKENALVVATDPGDTLSLIAFAPATVSVRGVKWEMKKSLLLPGTRGVSNEAAGKMAVVTMHSGAIIVCHIWNHRP